MFSCPAVQIRDRGNTSLSCENLVQDANVQASAVSGIRNGLGRIRTYDQPVMSRPLCH